MKLNKVLALVLLGMIQTAQGGEIDFSYRGVALGMSINDVVMPTAPSEFTNPHLSQFGKTFGILHIQLTKDEEFCRFGSIGNKDCFSASATLSDPELGKPMVLHIKATQAFANGPNFVVITDKLTSKYGAPRLTFQAKDSVYYVWGGTGELLHPDRGLVSDKSIRGKFIIANVGRSYREPSKTTGYDLQIVDGELRKKNGELLHKRSMNQNQTTPKQVDAIKF